MKVNISIECTPEEARAFFGLPDVRPLHEAVMTQVQEQMTANLKAMDAETLMKTWLPMGMDGLEKMQKAFWSGIMTATSQGKS